VKFLLSIPGHTRTIPMGRFVEEALLQMGHEVIVFNHERNDFTERIQEKISFKEFINYKNQQLLKLLHEIKPDVFFTIYGKTHDTSTIEKIKDKGILTICWWLNDPFDLAYKYIPIHLYDYAFTNSKGTYAVYKHYGAKNIHYLPVGIDPKVHRPLENIIKKYDVVFAGDWHPIREEVIKKLTNHHNIAIVGPWKAQISKNSPLHPFFIRQGYFTPVEMAEVFNQARIVFNLHTWYNRWTYGVNPRLFEACGCKAFQICDNKDEIEDLYLRGKEIILYQDVEEISELFTYYLDNEAQRNDIANQGFIRTRKDHTYVHRMQELLGMCNK
jgi:spore maturation protein CgeB